MRVIPVSSNSCERNYQMSGASGHRRLSLCSWTLFPMIGTRSRVRGCEKKWNIIDRDLSFTEPNCQRETDQSPDQH
jgi:hypothetical protein